LSNQCDAQRRNVGFELGFFMCRLGRHRTILLVPRSQEVKLQSETGKAVDYRRTDFFADLDFAAGLDSDFFAAGFLAAVFLAVVLFAEVFLAVVFFVVFFKTPALAVSDLTALPTGTLLTCLAAD